MGIFLLLAILAGVAAGLVVTVPFLIGAGLLARHLASTRSWVWPVALVAGAVMTMLFAAALGAGALPLRDVRPGNDYDILMGNVLMQATAYTASVGVGFMLGTACGLLCPRKVTPAE